LQRATLTVLTGVPQAGQVLVIGAVPITIGRAADADLVIDDPGVSEQHARVWRLPGSGFSIVDLGSTSGTFLGANRVGVALLRDGDLVRLGPSAQLRFAIID
jgi:pSer/pThr/pTyr-binding forkhead associated (FHA) protein